ncbi:hypothetical protein [Helicobacter sp. 23-1045]
MRWIFMAIFVCLANAEYSADSAPKIAESPQNTLESAPKIALDSANQNAESTLDSALYNDLQCPFIPTKYFIHNFIFAQNAQSSQSALDSAPKKPNSTFLINPNLMPLKPHRARVKVRGKSKNGVFLSEIALDSARRAAFSRIDEVSISQAYTLPFQQLQLTSAYTMLSNTEHHIKANLARSFYKWDFLLGYDFSNADLSSNAIYTNHALRARFGLNHNKKHKYSINFTYQKGEKSGLLKTYGDFQSVWHTPHYDKISAYIAGDSAILPSVRLKSKLYYNSFLNISRNERIIGGGEGRIYANIPYQNSTDNYSWGFIGSVAFMPMDGMELRLGVNGRRDNLKYTSMKWGEEREILRTSSATSDISTTIFAEYTQRVNSRVRFLLNGSYDRNDLFHSVVNNTISQNLATQDWSLQGIIYFDINNAWLLYLNAMKTSQVPTLKDSNIGSCAIKTTIPYSLESNFIYSVGACMQW